MGKFPDAAPFVTEYVLLEAINACSGLANRPRIHTLVAGLRGTDAIVWVPASSDLFETGLQLHAERRDKEWSLTDCISFVVMDQRGITQALIYDHHFEQAGFEALLRRDPP